MRILATFVSVLIVGTLSFTIAQEHIPSTEELLHSVPELANIPGFASFNTSSVKTEDIEKVLREKCEKNGGPDAYNVAKESPGHVSTCVQALVNVTELQSEMKEARPKGELDDVFKKYCRRIPSFKKCVRNLTDSIEPCLESEERDNIKIVHNITNSLLEFICYNEGDRIAMFIAAGGIECFDSKQKRVAACANETFNSYIPTANTAGGALPTVNSIPLLVLGLEQCRDIEKFQTCTVQVLEECIDPTPANVVDALLNFVKRVTPCENLLKARSAPVTANGSGFSSISSAVNVLLVTVLSVISLRFV